MKNIKLYEELNEESKDIVNYIVKRMLSIDITRKTWEHFQKKTKGFIIDDICHDSPVDQSILKRNKSEIIDEIDSIFKGPYGKNLTVWRKQNNLSYR